MTIEDRFMKHVVKTDSCWLWHGAKPNHYPSFRLSRNKIVKAHRFSFELVNRKLSDDECVLHSCDNPNCVNPAHLRAGDRTENNKERVAKGRSARPPTQVLSEDQVIEIRSKYIPHKVTQKHLASMYGVSRSAIASITQGVSWMKI